MIPAKTVAAREVGGLKYRSVEYHVSIRGVAKKITA